MLVEVNTHLTKENNQLKKEIEKLKLLVEELRKGAILPMQNRHTSTEKCNSRKNIVDKKLSKPMGKCIAKQ